MASGGTGWYMNPAAINKKNKIKKGAGGRDIRYHAKAMESACMLDANDFLSGNFKAPAEQPRAPPGAGNRRLNNQRLEINDPFEDEEDRIKKRTKREEGVDNDE